MTCRHLPGDTNCSSHPDNIYQRQLEYESQELKKQKIAEKMKTPDSTNYEVVDVQQIGNHLVLKVLYPNCSECSYEGNKVMVFLNTSTLDALKWKEIDPHFRNPTHAVAKNQAPGPAARFPASADGWADAISYARGK